MTEFKRHKIEWTSEKSARLWDYYASNSSYQNTFFGRRNGKKFIRLINRRLSLRRFPRIMDFSCGPGDIIEACLPYLSSSQSIAGCDYSSETGDVVNRRLAGRPNFRGAQVIREYPSELEDSSVDLLWSTEVVEHLNDEELAGMLNEFKRVLAPGGTLVLTTPNRENYAAQEVMCPDCGCEFHRWQHLRTYTAESLLETVDRHGFSNSSCEEAAWVPRWREFLTWLKPVGLDGLVYIGTR